MSSLSVGFYRLCKQIITLISPPPHPASAIQPIIPDTPVAFLQRQIDPVGWLVFRLRSHYGDFLVSTFKTFLEARISDVLGEDKAYFVRKVVPQNVVDLDQFFISRLRRLLQFGRCLFWDVNRSKGYLGMNQLPRTISFAF